MKPMHVGLIVAALSGAALTLGCGGGSPSVDSPVDSPDGAMPGEDEMVMDEMPDDTPDEGGEVAPSSGGDGIVRDADGDGKPDDEFAGCDGLSKTKCQITSGCAWSADEKCVEASGPM